MKRYFKNKKVLITGNTGFKGSWLSLWMHYYGAKVLGISNGYPSNPSNFKILNLKNKIKNVNIDIRNQKKLQKKILSFQPDFIFHLAAQALVADSYKSPRFTFETNTMGTLNLLESLKLLKKSCSVVLITSDKVYKNFEIKRGYTEEDILGGYDPYSASKASAEITIQSYIKSFFPKNKKVKIGIARAGNVLGGGDWSNNRLIPDCVKSWTKNKSVLIRNPRSTRPWQHVLEAVHGYLVLGLKLKKNSTLHGQAFNFGPQVRNVKNVLEVINFMKKNWKKVKFKLNSKKNKYYESSLLRLNSNKAKKLLNWKCILTFEETILMITSWYKSFYSKNEKIIEMTNEQINQFEKLIRKRN